MAGFFQNLRLVSERSTLDDMGAPASNAYATTSTNTTVAQASDTPIQNTETTSTINIQPTIPGFGAYLDGILPPDIATAAGAFSASMQQIKNISSIPVEKFAQVVTNLETTKGLNVNGTSVPTDTTLAQQGLNLIALGNGPYGTYTMSNFLGCMSGLPYLGINIRQLIQQLETPALYDAYKKLYLAVSWEAATISADYSTNPNLPSGPTTYTMTGITITEPGGGYGINGASAPTITITNGGGATATAIIGTNYLDAGSNGSGTYGRVTSIQFTGGSATTSIPTATIQTPPIVYGSSTNQSSGTAGWPGMNNAVQSYISDANTAIQTIKNSDPARAQQLITNWEKTGTLLSIEQRAIATGLPIRVPNSSPDNPREPTLAGYPTTQYSFVDSIPQYAKFTQPHMYSQTLEAISDLNTLGGRSLVAMLRQARNQDRLTEIGIPLDNNIEDTLNKSQEAQLIANGTLAGSEPATLETELGTPDPYGYYDPTTTDYINTNQLYDGNGEAIDTGQAIEPGSFAGSQYRNLISPELSAIYASKNLLPATYSIQEAIDEVIRCNCDCWDNI
jgi:hypothetical protein